MNKKERILIFMLNKTNFINEKSYFQYFEERYNDYHLCKTYPLIAQRMKEICEEIKKKIHNNQKEDFFQLHAEILGLDIQLQLILLFLNNLPAAEPTTDFLLEEQILISVKQDYCTFLCSHRLNFC